MDKVRSVIKTKMLSQGWVMLLLCFVFAFTMGMTLGIGMMVVLGLFFALLVLSCFFLGRTNLMAIDLDVRLKERIFAEKTYDLTMYLDNKKQRISSYFLDVDLELLHKQNVSGYVQWVGSGEGAKLKQRISIPHRGVTSSILYKVRSTFPLGLFEHKKEGKVEHEMLVYPRLISPRELLSYGSLNAENPVHGFVQGDTIGEIRGVRQWQPGDPAKRIHWAASAKSLSRGLGLRVKEVDPPGFTPESCVVLFHSYAEQGKMYRTDQFEKACSLASGVLNYLHSRNQNPIFIADFLGWNEIACINRKSYIELLAILSRAKRSTGTEVGKLQSVIDGIDADQLIVVSDMSSDTWVKDISLPQNGLVIDIRQVKFGRKRAGGA